jgi:hypothetical protein
MGSAQSGDLGDVSHVDRSPEQVCLSLHQQGRRRATAVGPQCLDRLILVDLLDDVADLVGHRVQRRPSQMCPRGRGRHSQ